MHKQNSYSIPNTVDTDKPSESFTNQWNISLEDSNVIKGIAIIMMFIHHSFFSTSWYVTPIQIPEYCSFIGGYCKLCVVIFAFLSGWVYAKGTRKGFMYSLKKSVQFYFSYLFTFIILAIISVLFCHWRPSISDIIHELFPLGNHQLMIFCWYTAFYPIALFLLGVCDTVHRVLPQKAASLFLVILILFCLYLSYHVGVLVFSSIGQFAIADIFLTLPLPILGYYLSKSRLLSVFCSFCQKSSIFYIPLFSISTLLFLLLLPYCGPRVLFHINPNCVYHFSFLWLNGLRNGILDTVCIITLLLLVNRITWIKPRRALSFLGKFSMNLWFVHCLFFSTITREVFQPLITFIPHPLIIPFSLFLFCIPPAILLQRIQLSTTKMIFSR